MAAREEEPKAGQGETPGAGPRPPTGRGKSGNDAVLRALSEVEETLARLKQVRTERAQAEARFKAELEAREKAERALASERDEAIAGTAALREQVKALQDELKQVRSLDKSRVDHAASERDKALVTTAELREQIKVLQDELKQVRSLEKSKLDQAASKRDEALAASAELREQVEALKDELKQVRSLDKSKLDLAKDERDEAIAARDELAKRAAGLEQALGQAQERLEALAAGATASERQREQALNAAQEARDAAVRDLERERAGAQEAARRQEQLESELARLREEFAGAQAALSEHSSQAEESRHDAAILSTKVEEQDTRIAELQGALQKAQSEVDRLKADCQAAIDSAADLERSARSAAAEHEAKAAEIRAQLEADLASAAAQVEEFRRTGDADASLRAEVETLRAALARASAEADELRAKLDPAAERLVELQAALEERDRRLAAGGDAETEALREELARAKKDLASLRKRRGKSAPADAEGAERLAVRRARLRRARELLRDRRRQFTHSSAMLAERMKMCDDLLARRRELAEAREIIERTHRKVIGGRARTSAAAVVFFAAGLLAVLGAASWAVTSHFRPATYVASAVLGADFRGTTPEPEEPEAWEQFHEQILLDPQVLGRVAERMKQRGFEDFSAPALLKAKLEQDLTWNAPEPGKLAFELRGTGRETTARMLDAYVTTLEVESNALRQRRNDSAQTIVAERARAGVEPIEDERPYYAAIGLAGAAAFALLLWIGIWRRMVRTKHAFEKSGEIDHLLEEARWVDPIQQLVQAQAKPQAHRSGEKAA